MSDCPICYSPFLDARETACGHCFCLDCIQRWNAHKSTCPLCASPLTLKTVQQVDCIPISIDKSKGEHPGVTVASSGGKLRVTRLVHADQFAKCGIRRGDIIVKFNDLHYNVADDFVRSLKHAVDKNVPICLTVTRPTSTSPIVRIAHAFGQMSKMVRH